MDGTPELVSRDQLLAGLGARRAGIALYALESRAGFLATRARNAAASPLLDHLVEAREQAFLSAMAAGRDLPQSVRVQDLERYAPALAHLVPPEPAHRAAVAVRLARKYPARVADVPRLRAALGVDTPEVEETLATRHGLAVDELWVAVLPWKERLRWWRSRLATLIEELPPFWTSYALTLTQTVGAGVLALPIALAGMGPLPGLVVVILLGFINVLTVTSIAEAFTRTGSVRWGGAYFGRVVGQYLGRPVRALVAAALLALAIVILLAYYVGFSSVLAAASGTPAPVWAAVLFAVTATLVWRGRLGATVATALLVGTINLAILVVLSVLAFTDLRLSNLTYAGFLGADGRSFGPGVVAVVFGVVLVAYFGHMSVANCARVVLIREGSGRDLSRGTAAGMLTAVVVYGGWTLAVGSAVHPDRLAGETGTALEPLAEAIGGAVLVLGAVFAVLAMGMAAVHVSFGLSYQVHDLVATAGTAGRLIGALPLLAVFAAAEVLLITNNESFTGSLGAIGTLALPIVAGVVPILLLAATRRRGDYIPGWTLSSLGNRSVLAAVHLVFVVALILHAAVLWASPLARLAAGVMALIMVVITARVLRSEAMRPLATVELRRSREVGRSQLSAVANGTGASVRASASARSETSPLVVEGTAELPMSADLVSVDLDGVPAEDIRVVVHEVDTAGASTPIDAVCTLRSPDGHLKQLPVDGSAATSLRQPATLEIELSRSRGRPDGVSRD